MLSQVNASITRSSDNGEERGTAEFADDGAVATLTFDNAVAASNASALSVSYTIGTANYRFEFR